MAKSFPFTSLLNEWIDMFKSISAHNLLNNTGPEKYIPFFDWVLKTSGTWKWWDCLVARLLTTNLLVNMFANIKGRIPWWALNMCVQTAYWYSFLKANILHLIKSGTVWSSFLEFVITLIALFCNKVRWFKVVILVAYYPKLLDHLPDKHV